jgi:hypothetical protein
MMKFRLALCVSALTCNVALAWEPPFLELACTTSDASYYYTNSRETEKVSDPKQNFSIRSSSDKETEIFVSGPKYGREHYSWPFDDKPFRLVNFDYQNGLFVYIGGSELSDHANHVGVYRALVTVSIKRPRTPTEKFQVTMSNPKRTGDILIIESDCDWIGKK